MKEFFFGQNGRRHGRGTLYSGSGDSIGLTGVWLNGAFQGLVDQNDGSGQQKQQIINSSGDSFPQEPQLPQINNGQQQQQQQAVSTNLDGFGSLGAGLFGSSSSSTSPTPSTSTSSTASVTSTNLGSFGSSLGSGSIGGSISNQASSNTDLNTPSSSPSLLGSFGSSLGGNVVGDDDFEDEDNVDIIDNADFVNRGSDNNNNLGLFANNFNGVGTSTRPENPASSFLPQLAVITTESSNSIESTQVKIILYLI